MTIRKALILATLVMAFAALAIPAVASATTLKDGGKEVADREFEITGTWGFGGLGGRVECVVHAKITVNGLVVRVVKFETTTATCVGSGGLAGCTVTNDAPKNLPWTVDPDPGGVLTITGFTISLTLSPTVGKTCAPKNLEFSVPHLFWAVDNSKSIHSGSLSGEGSELIEGVEVEAEASGSLEVVGTDSGTYEIA